ncbi:MAG: hypothetical protein AB7U74_08175 [Afipia sp.]
MDLICSIFPRGQPAPVTFLGEERTAKRETRILNQPTFVLRPHSHWSWKTSNATQEVVFRPGPSGEIIAEGPHGFWGITPFEGNFYISRKCLKSSRLKPNWIPGLCLYKFLYVWLDLRLPDGTCERSIGWMYWLPNQLFDAQAVGRCGRISVMSKRVSTSRSRSDKGRRNTCAVAGADEIRLPESVSDCVNARHPSASGDGPQWGHARRAGQQRRRRQADDEWSILIDLPLRIPVLAAELIALETHLGDAIDAILAGQHGRC